MPSHILQTHFVRRKIFTWIHAGQMEQSSNAASELFDRNRSHAVTLLYHFGKHRRFHRTPLKPNHQAWQQTTMQKLTVHF
jgi:hypothetical protein